MKAISPGSSAFHMPSFSEVLMTRITFIASIEPCSTSSFSSLFWPWA